MTIDSRGSGRGSLAVCLAISGFTSLVFEIVWVRQLRLLFGSTTLAIGSAVAAFMLGLALGGILGARLARSGRARLSTYGWLELAAAGWGALVPSIVALLPGLVPGSLAFWPATAFRFALVLAALLPATCAMGATLPVAVAALARSPVSGDKTALLYGMNTLGATAGAFGTAFLLFSNLGVKETNLAAALLEGGLAIFVLLVLAPKTRAESGADASSGQPEASAPFPDLEERFAIAIYGVVGFSSLALEVCWERALSMVVGASVYSFSCILAAFLAGIGAGSLLVRPWLPAIRRPRRLLAAGIAAFAILSLITTALFQWLPGIFVRLIVTIGLSPAGFTLTAAAVSALALLPPTLVLGALFPVAAKLAAGTQRESGEAVGKVYFVNTLGGAIGSFAGGFLLIPRLGLRGTIELACVAALLSGAFLFWREAAGGERSMRLAAALSILAVSAAVLLPAPWRPERLVEGVFRFPVERLPLPVETLPMRGGYDDEHMLFYRDGVNATVSVQRHWGETYLKVNGKADAGTGSDMSTQVFAGEIPMVFGPPARSVMVIGLASGVTAGSIALHHPDRLDVVELEPSVVAASHLFDRVNNRPLEQPFTHLILNDGRIELARKGPLYDVIVSEPSNPWMSSAANLFTREFFHLVKRRLAPGGRLFQWVQLYGIRPSSLEAILAALRSEFPQVYGFAETWGGPDLLLLASEQPLSRGSFPLWESFPPAVQADLQRVGTFSTADLRSLLRIAPIDADALARLATRPNSDDDMEVELRSFFEMYDTGDVLGRNWAVIGATSKAVMSGAAAPSREAIGDLALSFAETRNDLLTADALVRAAPPGPGSALAAAEIARRRGQSAETVGRMLDDVVARFPDSFDARRIRGRWRVDNALPGAIEDLEDAIASAPRDPRPRYDLLRALNAAGRAESAYAESRGVRLASPTKTNPQILVETARAELAAGHFEEAARDLRGFLEWNPYSPDQWKMLATAERGRGNAGAAADALVNAEAARQNVVRRLYQFALRAEVLGAKPAAIAYLKEALEVDPSYAPARMDLTRLGAS
ncbi:MAG: fused MFS/spermidine synthase [Thermoanaerobaculia bacterium]